MAAEVPAQPVAPTTWISGLNVVVGWSAPDNGGSTLISYTIALRESDGSTFTTVACTESSADVLVYTVCTVPIATLKAEPYSLPWG